MKVSRIVLALAVSAVVLIICLSRWIIKDSLNPSPESYDSMKERAILAIGEIGIDTVEVGARKILRGNREEEIRLLWDSVDFESSESSSSAIMKLNFMLSPPCGGHIWLSERKRFLPDFLVIRFGSHNKYCYLWVFDAQDLPSRELTVAEKLFDAVYITEHHVY